MTKLGTLDLSSTSAEKGFFGKKIEGGSPKKILEKKNVFPKKYVELRTFDGNNNKDLLPQ
jgi:hypothetical protein